MASLRVRLPAPLTPFLALSRRLRVSIFRHRRLATLTVTALTLAPLTPAVRAQSVTPALDHVTYTLNTNIVMASFGYSNSSADTVAVAFGTSNFFLPSPPFRNQPTQFLSGTHASVFSVGFAGSTFAEWNLLGQKLRATIADTDEAFVTANYTHSAGGTFPLLTVKNGAALTVGGPTLTVQNGVTLESGTRLRLTDGLLDTPSITATGGLATLEFDRAASTAASPLFFTRNNTAGDQWISISGAIKLRQVSGYTVLDGNPTHTGGTELAGGTLQLVSAGVLLSSSGPISFSGGTLAYGPVNATDYSALFSTADGQAYSIDTNGQSVLFASALTSVGGSLTKSGAGTLRLGGANTYSGGTTLLAGTLALENDSAVGTGTITLRGGTLRASLAARTLANAVIFAGDIALGRATTFTGSVTVSADTTLGAGNPDGLANGATTLTGPVSLERNLTLVDGTGWGTGGPVFSGAISGAGALTQSSHGMLTLGGANSYSGGTTLNAGTLLVASNTALGTGTVALNGGNLGATGGARTLANAVVFNTDTTFTGDSRLTLAGDFTLARTRELNVEPGSTLAISGAIGQSGGSRALLKHGAGTLELTGANTYTGGTLIADGTVRINNPTGSAFGTGAVTIDADGTLTGAGVFSGALQNNGTYAPGNSPALASLSSFNQGPTGLLEIEIAGLDRGTGYDALDVAGTLTFGGTLNVVTYGAFTPASFAAGQSFDLFNWGSATGTFATLNLPDLAAYGLSWDISALYSTGVLSVTASAVPEPSTYAALLGACALALVALRRRRVV